MKYCLLALLTLALAGCFARGPDGEVVLTEFGKGYADIVQHRPSLATCSSYCRHGHCYATCY